MAKYTGTFRMADTGPKEQNIVAGKIKVKLDALFGTGQMATNVGIDDMSLLKWTYITDNDETPAQDTVVIDPNKLDDPAAAEILEHREADTKEAKALAKRDKVDHDELGAKIGSQAEADAVLTPRD